MQFRLMDLRIGIERIAMLHILVHWIAFITNPLESLKISCENNNPFKPLSDDKSKHENQVWLNTSIDIVRLLSNQDFEFHGHDMTRVNRH